MERSGEIGDGAAVSVVEGVHPVSDQELDAAFEVFRKTLDEARRIGSVTAMRAAVEAYDKFAEVCRTNK